MLTFRTVDQSIQVLLAGAVATNQLPVITTYVDINDPNESKTDDSGILKHTATNSTTAVTLVNDASITTYRRISRINVFNADTASVTITFRLQDTSSGTVNRVITTMVVPAGYTITYFGGRFQVTDEYGGGVIRDGGAAASGTFVTQATESTLPSSRRLAAGTNITLTDGGALSTLTLGQTNLHVHDGRVAFSMNSGSAASTALLSTGVAYCVYLGKLQEAKVFKHVKFRVSVVGAGSQTAEVGLFSSPLAPNGSSQTLTKLWADGTIDTLTASAVVKKNTNASVVSIPAGTHLWAVLRTAMATTQITCAVIQDDWVLGFIGFASPGVLTGLSSFSYTPTALAGWAPDLRATMDA